MRLRRNLDALAVLLSGLPFCLVSATDSFLLDNLFGLSFNQFWERIPRLGEYALAQRDVSRRDVCTDAIPGTVTATCTPGNTLCCVPSDPSVSFPQCQQILGKGFCCVEGQDCYIDTVSNCSVPNAVQCSMLTADTTEACCPPFTTCPNNFNQSAQDVRCNIIQSAVASSTPVSSSSSTSSKSSSTSSSSSSSTSTSAASSISITTLSSSIVGPTPTTSSTSSSKPLSAGQDAGIGIGVAISVLALIGIGFLVYRRGKRRGEARAMQRDAELNSQAPLGRSPYPSPYSDTQTSHVLTGADSELTFNGGSQYRKYELAGDGSSQVAELMDNSHNLHR